MSGAWPTKFLFDNGLVQFDRAHAAGKPFLAQIMATPNHRTKKGAPQGAPTSFSKWMASVVVTTWDGRLTALELQACNERHLM